jgi:5-methyltetrahydrofolate--homocysteine methyltransferase
MVPAAEILEAVREHRADIVGVSGLITPSLDEMINVAGELDAKGFDIPLLIGGATTSRIHTAVKIEPAYNQAVVYVPDACRAIAVVSKLLGDDRRDYVGEVADEYEAVRRERAASGGVARVVDLESARANAAPIDWAETRPVEPTFIGARTVADISPGMLRDFIDWTPFFQAWDLAGSYPRILDDEVVGPSARDVFADACAMLDRLIEEEWLQPRVAVGFWPAAGVGDDIVVFSDATRSVERARIHTLRQQVAHHDGRPNFALADFIAPADSGVKDWLGMFAVTAGAEVAVHATRFENADDDYQSIMLKALSDRLAEACAEYLHHLVRTDLWGYQDQSFTSSELISERYQGIRPAPGYPACPDHTEKRTIFELLDAPTRAGMTLTENCAMAPASSVSGLYFSHPESRYFGVRKVCADQLEDYAARKGMSVTEAARWLAPVVDRS